MSGFITISRRLFKNDLWTERREFSRAEAWLDLIRRANWQDGTMLVGNTPYEIKRGQVLASERQMAQWWGWSQKKVQNFLRLCTSEEMISTAKEAVGTRMDLKNYESYNNARNQDGISTGTAYGSDTEKKGITKESGGNHLNATGSVSCEQQGENSESRKNQDGIRMESGWNQEGIQKGIMSNNINKKEKEKEKQTPQAGGFDFEKLAKQVGQLCAKLIIEGGVTDLLDNAKKRLFVKWANHKFTSGNEIRTTAVLAEVVKKFQATDTDLLEESISESIGGNYARLVIAKPKTTTTAMPSYWKAGIEIEMKMTPETTIKYHRHLLELGWRKENYQGKTNWLKPQTTTTAARTGETTLAASLNGQAQ